MGDKRQCEFSIGGATFDRQHTVVIAEAGVNHNGSLAIAEALIVAAARAGAQVVKFQTYKASDLTTTDAPRFWKWSGEASAVDSQYETYSKLDSFGRTEYEILFQLCHQYGVEFLSTPFDFHSTDLLEDIGVRGFKIASCDITNAPLLRHVARKGLPILLSTGASEIDEIRAAVDTMLDTREVSLLLMHCTLCYPTRDRDANLAAIPHLQSCFPEHLVGLSDHTPGTLVPASSVLYGTSAIEKHFTVDKTLPLSFDHTFGVDEAGLTQLVHDVATLRSAMGTGTKRVLACERLARDNARRSVVAVRPLVEGELVTLSDVAFKRPGVGVAPRDVDKVLGKRTTRKIEYDELILESDVR